MLHSGHVDLAISVDRRIQLEDPGKMKMKLVSPQPSITFPPTMTHPCEAGPCGTHPVPTRSRRSGEVTCTPPCQFGCPVRRYGTGEEEVRAPYGNPSTCHHYTRLHSEESPITESPSGFVWVCGCPIGFGFLAALGRGALGPGGPIRRSEHRSGCWTGVRKQMGIGLWESVMTRRSAESTLRGDPGEAMSEATRWVKYLLTSRPNAGSQVATWTNSGISISIDDSVTLEPLGYHLL